MGQIKTYPNNSSLSSSDRFLVQNGSTDETEQTDASTIRTYTRALVGARVKRATTQSVTTTTDTTIAWTGEDFDTGGFHDNVTNNSRLTIPETGYYSLGAMINWDAWDVSATAYRMIVTLYKNGVNQYDLYDESVSNNGGETSFTVSDFVSATAADYFEFHVYQGTPNTRALTTVCHAWIKLEGY